MKSHQIPGLSVYLVNMQPIVLFDGECTLCNRAVKFLLRHNHSGNLRFTSLQSAVGSDIVKLAGKTFEHSDTLLLLQDNILYSYSTAALKLTAHLRFPWRLLRIFILVPPIIRDTLYRFTAKNRYKWFGRKSFCMTDENRNKERFLG
jgi:predicted DCC family thiol-disulfide oxidoreductase YuxK